MCNTNDLSCANDGWTDIKKTEREELEEIEKEDHLINEQKTLQEELTKATKMLEEERTGLATAINNREFNKTSIAEVLVTTANSKISVLHNQLIENSEKLNRLRKTKKK